LDGIALASPIKMGYKSYNKGDKMLHKKDEIRKHFEDWIRDQDSDWIEANLDDLHHHCFNTDYYIIGTWNATQWLGDQVFNVIETIRDYEMNNFGEVNTDFSDPEKVVNMYTYIIGEEIVEEYKDKISKAVA
jgi:hypothetical protein